MRFVHGAVTENDTVTTGWFVAAMHIDAADLIARYQVSFNSDFGCCHHSPRGKKHADDDDGAVPVLTRWFDCMDSDDPDRVVCMISVCSIRWKGHL